MSAIKNQCACGNTTFEITVAVKGTEVWQIDSKGRLLEVVAELNDADYTPNRTGNCTVCGAEVVITLD